MTTTVTSTAKAVSTSGGIDISTIKFNLRVVSYDKSALRAAVREAIAACRQEWFYNSGWDIYVRDLNNAVDVLNKPNTTQALIDEATANLLDAESWLEFKSADYIELYQTIAIANSLNPFDYTNFRTVSTILDEIRSKTNNLNILDQALLNDYCDKLKEAMDGLNPIEAKVIIRCYDTTDEVEPNTEGVTPPGKLLSSSELVGNVGEKVIVDIPVVDGYNSVAGQTNQIATIENGNTYVDFLYTPKTYLITLNTNGGSIANNQVQIVYGQTYADLPVPTRANFVFDGIWEERV